MNDPHVPQPGDPTTMTLEISGNDLQLIVAGLKELPARLSHELLNRIQKQVDATVLRARAAQQSAETTQ